jgi:hypothetical protein
MGGIDQFVGGDLVPTTVSQVFDPANPAAGWQTIAPMPVASGEGRGFGFDADTLNGVMQPWSGKLYVVGGGDWTNRSAEVMEYDIATDTWDQAFPDLITARRDHAGTFVPLCTTDPNDGLPGMWVFGGNIGAVIHRSVIGILPVPSRMSADIVVDAPPLQDYSRQTKPGLTILNNGGEADWNLFNYLRL